MLELKDYIKLTENEFASVANDGISAGDISGYIDSGSYAMNALLSADIYGGYPSNKIVLCGSPSSTGKCMRGDQVIEIYFESEDELENFLKGWSDWAVV